MTHPAATGGASPTGLPLDRLRAWLDPVVPGGCGPLVADPIPGGRSNLTYRITDGEREWVVRRPPLGEHLATAHDVGREHRILAALADTEVPVPRTWGLCEDLDVVGAPFYVMDHVAGTTYRTREDLAGLDAVRVRALSERLVDVLVQIHHVPVDEVGLAGRGRPVGYLERQVRRWYAQLEGAGTAHLDLARRLHDLLRDAVPVSRHVGLVHGDLRLDNVLVSPDDRILAVIDWELSTVGDTMTDLALMVGYRRLAEQVRSDVVPNASVAEGHLDEDGLLQRYAAGSGRPLEDVDFHLALAFFKIAGIVAGIDDRQRRGQLVGAGVDRVGETVAPLLRAGIELLTTAR